MVDPRLSEEVVCPHCGYDEDFACKEHIANECVQCGQCFELKEVTLTLYMTRKVGEEW